MSAGVAPLFEDQQLQERSPLAIFRIGEHSDRRNPAYLNESFALCSGSRVTHVTTAL
jgi:hypothetical protein